MGKAIKKEEVAVVKESTIPSGMQAKDLSLEKRIELYQSVFDKFKKDTEDTFGLAMTVELVFDKRGVIPRMSLVDLLKQPQNEQANQNQSQG